MNKVTAALTRIWNHKQAITGAVTTVVSLLAGANIIADATAVTITAVTGALVTGFAVIYSIISSPTPPAA
jgi:hypothetical protein